MEDREPRMPELLLFEHAEAWVNAVAQWLRLGVETLGVLTIGIGIVVVISRMCQDIWQRRAVDFLAVRLRIARYLALALELQLGADILSTAIAPNWERIGKLAAIAIIRTGLNYFLSREMRDDQSSEQRRLS